MKYLKRFNESIDFNSDKLYEHINDIMLPLVDYGFGYKADVYDDDVLIVSISKKDKSNFIYSDVKDYFLTIIDLYKEMVGIDLDISYDHYRKVIMYGQEHFLGIKSEPSDEKLISSVDCTICNLKGK